MSLRHPVLYIHSHTTIHILHITIHIWHTLIYVHPHSTIYILLIPIYVYQHTTIQVWTPYCTYLRTVRYMYCTVRYIYDTQCVAVCCSVLQCVAVCCSVLQCVVRYMYYTLRYISDTFQYTCINTLWYTCINTLLYTCINTLLYTCINTFRYTSQHNTYIRTVRYIYYTLQYIYYTFWYMYEQHYNTRCCLVLCWCMYRHVLIQITTHVVV